MSKIDKEKINNVNFSGRKPNKNILNMIAYQFEIVYNLTIFPINIVSASGGFESCLGVYNK